ncbi:MAG: hypothetical protein KC416_07790 [Myxococcales bacterium]|nr:hypothetical protein [Myxococcales bacterium]
MGWKETAAFVGLLLSMVACTADTPVDRPTDDPEKPTAPKPGTGEEPDELVGRSPVRMTAKQYFQSLTVVTGQEWPDYDEFAAILGRPDYQEITEEGRQMSVGFTKVIGDAARTTCSMAVEADRNQVKSAERAILRFVDLDTEEAARLAENVRYLLLRFLGQHVTANDDPRVLPWMDVLTTDVSGLEGSPTKADVMALRWTAVCVGLATHPDFVAY